MNRLTTTFAAALVCAGFAVCGCDQGTSTTSGTGGTATGGGAGTTSGSASGNATATGSGATTTDAGSVGTAAGANANAEGKTATATLQPSDDPGMDDVKGTITFTATGHGVRVQANVEGLTPNGTHGFHIHEKGDLSDPKLTSAGPHFNPTGGKHGGPEGDARHGGDLGNLKADANGKATYEGEVHGISIDGEKDGIVGRSVIVHAKEDDLKTDPSGNSGARIAGGVIELKEAGASGGGGDNK